ncbi:unnamed protein product [Vitrella brassicaformis CCMP3155]|uniref:Uncharacterized protein n=1 Tax=Vitrella brassicaformis (strain CCMP3155) TaxID=1169540 RepID=A0A0G4GXE6_VITBC|nr:unnamed protein product [Vitrella brassicaformis CCMP3155]|eukprot:CEM35462.1 unnamed protein product [Vitrella brassicaformis CCMP3155]
MFVDRWLYLVEAVYSVTLLFPPWMYRGFIALTIWSIGYALMANRIERWLQIGKWKDQIRRGLFLQSPESMILR